MDYYLDYYKMLEDIRLDIKKLSEDIVPVVIVILVNEPEKAAIERKISEGLESWNEQPGSRIDPKRAVVLRTITHELYQDFVDAVCKIIDTRKINPEYKGLLSKLKEKLSPCIVVRFGSLYRLYRTVDDSSLNEVVRLALEFGTNQHFVLVVGDPVNLKEELTVQVLQVCKLAQLEDNEIKKMLDYMKREKKMSYHCANLEQSRAVSLLLSPTVAELQKVLSNSVSWDIHIIYAGHADTDGSWIFADGYFDEEDIRESIRCVEVCYNIYLVLDCCYASKLFNTDKHIKRYIEAFYFADPTAMPKMSLHPLTDVNKAYVKWNEIFTTMMVVMYTGRNPYEKNSSTNLKRLFPVNVPLDVIGGSSIPAYIYPLSKTYLGPQGAMNALYGIDEKVKEYTKGSIYFSRGPPLERAMDNHLRPTDYPQLVCFPAGNGDSTLFRWHGFNMLIDGGIYTSPPCFWPVVRRLPLNECLDEVIVTHYDDDHINGILGLFQERELPIAVKRLHTVAPGEDAPVGGRSVKKGAELVKEAGVKWVPIRNLGAFDFPVIHVHFIRRNGEVRPHVMNAPGCDINGEYNGECLRVYMLTPTNTACKERVENEVRTKLDELNKQKKKKEGRGLTDPNMASASLLIHCRLRSGTSRFALLTGDAPCQPILEGLGRIQCVPKRRDGKYKLHYADVPHHGSRLNDPDRFFSEIAARFVVISTDGRYGHPHSETRKSLNDVMKKGSVRHAFFTYEHGADVQECFDPCVRKRLHFAKNRKKDKKPVIICFNLTEDPIQASIVEMTNNFDFQRL